MKPTDEQIKEFWEWCGFILKELHPLAPKGSSCVHCGHSEQVLPSEEPYFVLYKPDGEQYNLWIGRKWDTEIPIRKLYPPIDLNNLFKYAVPKLEELGVYWELSQKPDCVVVAGIFYNKKAFWKFTNLKWIYKSDEDPALALFWAIYGVIK